MVENQKELRAKIDKFELNLGKLMELHLNSGPERSVNMLNFVLNDFDSLITAYDTPINRRYITDIPNLKNWHDTLIYILCNCDNLGLFDDKIQMEHNISILKKYLSICEKSEIEKIRRMPFDKGKKNVEWKLHQLRSNEILLEVKDPTPRVEAERKNTDHLIKMMLHELEFINQQLKAQTPSPAIVSPPPSSVSLPIVEELGNFVNQSNKEPDFSNLLEKIKYDKNETTKKKVENILNQLNERELLKRSNKKDFTTIALILYKTGVIINTNTFSEWLKLFSVAFERSAPTCKPGSLKSNIEIIERKFPFLNPPK